MRGRGRFLATSLAVLLVLAPACAPDPPGAVVAVTGAGCPPATANGTGVVIGDDLVLVSAHVVKGSEEVEVRRGRHTATGEVVAFDPAMDLAVVRVDTGSTRPLSRAVLSSDVAPGARAHAYVVRDGAVSVLAVTVRRAITIHTEDIYVEGDTFRPGLELDAEIRAGDSGGPVVVDGEVVGVLWARSSKADRRAYAIDPERAGDTIRSQLASGTIDGAIDLGRCY